MINKEGTPLESKNRALAAARSAASKKARDITILELMKLTVIADYFVICSGESTTQVRAIADAVREDFDKKKIRLIGIEGASNNQWVLLDFGDVVVHVFEQETRDYYQLEKLWLDAPKIFFEEKG